jgi:hypothetical protein
MVIARSQNRRTSRCTSACAAGARSADRAASVSARRSSAKGEFGEALSGSSASALDAASTRPNSIMSSTRSHPAGSAVCGSDFRSSQCAVRPVSAARESRSGGAASTCARKRAVRTARSGCPANGFSSDANSWMIACAWAEATASSTPPAAIASESFCHLPAA